MTSYVSIPDASFQDVVNLWFSTDPPGNSAEFNDPYHNPFYGPIQYWDTQLVTDMSNAFYLQSSFNENISLWNTSNVTNMYRMFADATRYDKPLNTQYISAGINPYIQTPYTAWDVSGVQNMSYMFAGAINFNQPLNNWDVSSVTNMSVMFSSTNAFNQPLNNWNVSNVTTMTGMFLQANNFNQPLNNWNVGNVTTMRAMFQQAVKFDQNIESWDVGNVTDMNSMFSLAIAFNQPLNNWNVSDVSNMDLMFSDATAFNQPLNNWNVGNVTTMNSMFYNAIAFNQPLNNWNVGNVTTMESMFSYATAFNQPLFHWDVSNVTTFEEMFKVATTFDQYIRSWDVSSSAILTNMFAGSYTGNQCPLATDKSLWNTENNTDTVNKPPGPTPTVNGYFNQDLSGSYAPYYSYNYLQHPNQIIIVTQPGSPTGAGLYTLNSVTPSEIPNLVTIDQTTGTLTISTADILVECRSNQVYTINITENTSPASTSIIIVKINNTPRKPNAFPFPLEQKNKSLHGVNQKLDPGTARPNYFITRSQFNPARFRSKQSNLSNPSLCFF